jgi:protein-tyrosine phosphatase
MEVIDLLEHPALGPGRLGMTACPGRVVAPEGVDPLARDLARWRELGVLHVVCLLPDYELDSLGVKELPRQAARHGLDFWHHPIDDGRAPRDVAAFRSLVERARVELSAGHTLVVHCRAGFGRTGTFAAACLVHGGVAPADALVAVRKLRAFAVETREQERFLASLSG